MPLTGSQLSKVECKDSEIDWGNLSLPTSVTDASVWKMEEHSVVPTQANLITLTDHGSQSKALCSVSRSTHKSGLQGKKIICSTEQGNLLVWNGSYHYSASTTGFLTPKMGQVLLTFCSLPLGPSCLLKLACKLCVNLQIRPVSLWQIHFVLNYKPGKCCTYWSLV